MCLFYVQLHCVVLGGRAQRNQSRPQQFQSPAQRNQNPAQQKPSPAQRNPNPLSRRLSRLVNGLASIPAAAAPRSAVSTGAPRRIEGVTGRRSFSTLQAIARFLLFVNKLAPPYSHGGPADLTASPSLHVWTTRAKPRKHSLPLSPVAPRAAIDGASGGVRLRFNTRSDETGAAPLKKCALPNGQEAGPGRSDNGFFLDNLPVLFPADLSGGLFPHPDDQGQERRHASVLARVLRLGRTALHPHPPVLDPVQFRRRPDHRRARGRGPARRARRRGRGQSPCPRRCSNMRISSPAISRRCCLRSDWR